MIQENTYIHDFKITNIVYRLVIDLTVIYILYSPMIYLYTDKVHRGVLCKGHKEGHVAPFP